MFQCKGLEAQSDFVREHEIYAKKYSPTENGVGIPGNPSVTRHEASYCEVKEFFQLYPCFNVWNTTDYNAIKHGKQESLEEGIQRSRQAAGRFEHRLG